MRTCIHYNPYAKSWLHASIVFSFHLLLNNFDFLFSLFKPLYLLTVHWTLYRLQQLSQQLVNDGRSRQASRCVVVWTHAVKFHLPQFLPVELLTDLSYFFKKNRLQFKNYTFVHSTTNQIILFIFKKQFSANHDLDSSYWMCQGPWARSLNRSGKYSSFVTDLKKL